VPAMSWKRSPRKGHLLVQIPVADGAAADGTLIEIHKVGGGPGDETILQYADGNGYVGAIDLNPGAYQLLITVGGEPGLRAAAPQPVVPGRVTRMVVRLGHPSRGPMLRSDRVLGARARRPPDRGFRSRPVADARSDAGRHPRESDRPAS
jgi:hypothetical protein